MTDRRFDGRVAVVTGGARGLGRAYAELLGSLGAKVLINDNGSALSGSGSDAGPAEEAAQVLRNAGYEAMASTDSVATPEGGKAIVEAALDTFGRIDVLIHNAGNNRFAMLEEISYDDFRAVVDVHLLGAFHVVRPAFERMVKDGYGRIVLTGSIGGLFDAQRSQLCGFEVRDDRPQQYRRDRGRRARCEIQYHSARRGHSHGRGPRYLSVSANGA